MSGERLFNELVARYVVARVRYPQLKPITLAQWMLESGRGTSRLAIEHYNFGGLKWRAEMKPYAAPVLYDAHDGTELYCRFLTPEAFIEGYWAFIARTPYSGWEEHSQSGESFIRFIGPTYCPTAGYVEHVLALLPEAEKLLGTNGGIDTESATPIQPDRAERHFGAIILDPGHGGTKDLPGSSWNNTKSASGVLEKTLTLEWCQALRTELQSQAAASGRTIDVVMTRSSDVNVAGVSRAALALAHNAKLFLSIHFNSNGKSTVGTETYYGAKENGNVNLADDLKFAKAVQEGVLSGYKAANIPHKDRGIKPDTLTYHKKLAVLSDINLGNSNRQDKCRAALLEVDFIPNPEVDKRLVSGPDATENRKAIIRSLAKAILGEMER